MESYIVFLVVPREEVPVKQYRIICRLIDHVVDHLASVGFLPICGVITIHINIIVADRVCQIGDGGVHAIEHDGYKARVVPRKVQLDVVRAINHAIRVTTDLVSCLGGVGGFVSRTATTSCGCYRNRKDKEIDESFHVVIVYICIWTRTANSIVN